MINIMRLLRMSAAAVATVLLAGACHSQARSVAVQQTTTSAARADASPGSSTSTTARQQRHPSQPTGAVATSNSHAWVPPGPLPHTTTKQADPTAPGAKPATASDDWATRNHVPPGWILVTQGQTQTTEWREYAQQQQDGTACYGLFMQSSTGGGGGTNCAPGPMAVSESDVPRIVFGLVVPNSVRVVVEHSGTPAETLPTVAPSGFAFRFFAGEVGSQPITRIVAYDGAGRVVAQDTDVASLNS